MSVSLAVACLPFLKFVPPKKVLELFLTGRIIDANEAKEIGMVNFVVQNDRVYGFVDEIVNGLISRSSLALKMGKEVFDFLVQENYTEKIKYLREMSSILASSSKSKIEEFLFKSKK